MIYAKNTLAIFLLLGIFISGCAQPVTPENNDNTDVSYKEIPRFKDYNEMVAAFSENPSRNYGVGGIAKGMIEAPMMAVETASDSAQGAGTTEHSNTNVQVEGVDEADIVKTDGKYIYVLGRNSLSIIDAYPAESGEIISKIEFIEGFYPQEFFLYKEKILVFGSQNSYDVYNAGMTRPMMPRYYGGGNTVVYLYDISDKQNPSKEKELSISGSYLTSRLVGNNAVFVVNSYPYYGYYGPQESGEGQIIPLMVEDGVESKIAEASQIGYIRPMPIESFVSIFSLDMENGETEKEVIAASAQNVFASQENIYLAATAWMLQKIPVLEDVNEADKIAQTVLGDSENTVINKFSFKDGNINFVGQGQVPGNILNQFSMDEYEGNFRIATTTGAIWGSEEQSTNNLYVLDSGMDQIGKLEGLAPGEKIYSARFMGKKAYMVTFKTVDPLFVIDLSEPTDPKVLGKLKIPGYSDYLHPIDETHLIGVGKDVDETIDSDKVHTPGAVYYTAIKGIKMAIFDVSDVANPKELHKVVIGDRGSESPVLQDHKAFLYDAQKELLVLPVQINEFTGENKEYSTPVFSGALVYKLTLENGFEERGRISHVTEEEELLRGYYYGSDSAVKRSLFIGNVLYTLSGKLLKANDLGTLEAIKDFKFE